VLTAARCHGKGRAGSTLHTRAFPLHFLPHSLSIPFIPLRAQTTLILTGATWSSWSSRCRRLALLLATCPGVLPPCAAILPARLATAQRPPPESFSRLLHLSSITELQNKILLNKLQIFVPEFSAVKVEWALVWVWVCVCTRAAVPRACARLVLWPSVNCCGAFDAASRQRARHRDPKP